MSNAIINLVFLIMFLAMIVGISVMRGFRKEIEESTKVVKSLNDDNEKLCQSITRQLINERGGKC